MPSHLPARRSVALAIALLMAAPWANAQSQPVDFPNRPIRIVVPFGAGSGADLSARRVAVGLARVLGQSIVIENKPGAGGIIGTEFVAKSPPDGYTLLAGTMSTHAINVGAYKSLPYDPVKDFAPISRTNSFPSVLVVSSSLGVSNVKELIALAKQRSQPLTAASGGPGTTPHLAAVLLGSAAGIDLLNVSYKNTNQYLPDVMAGRVDMVFGNVPSVLPHIRGGRLKALAITTPERSPLLPEVPTFAESGLKDAEMSIWIAFFAPAGTPPSILARLNGAVRQSLSFDDVRQGLINDGSQVESDESPNAFGAFVKNEVDRWVKIVRAAGAMAD